MPWMSVPTPGKGKPDSEVLIIPDALEPLDNEDYPNVQYWHDKDWIKHTERQRDREASVLRLGFLTNRDGNIVLESQIKVFTSTAKQA